MNIWLKIILLPVIGWFIMFISMATVGEFWEVNRSGFDEWLIIMSIVVATWTFIGCYWVVMGIYGKIGHYLKRLK